MNLLKTLFFAQFFVLVVASFVNAASPDTVSSRESSISPEEALVLNVLLQSPMFMNEFTQYCETQSGQWLGEKQAEKSCRCAYDRLVKDSGVLKKIMGSLGGDGELAGYEKWGYDFVEPCLPEQFPAEMEIAFLNWCLAQGDVDNATCKCVLQSIKKDYTVRTLVKSAFDDRKTLELNVMLKTAQCLSK